MTNSIARSLSVLTVGRHDADFSGLLQDGGGTLGLRVAAPGGMTLIAAEHIHWPYDDQRWRICNWATARISHDGTIANASGITDNGLLVYNLFGTQTASYAITGNTNGAVTKTGGGTLTLVNGGNTYSGGTNVLQGLMVIAPGSNALPTGPLNVSGGSMDLEGNSPLISTLGGSSTIGNGSSGTANLANLYVDPDPSASSTFSGTIRDGGFGGNSQIALNLSGGSLTLTGTNSYTGGTYVYDGSLIATNSGAFEDGSNLYVGADAASFSAVIPMGSPVSGASARGEPWPRCPNRAHWPCWPRLDWRPRRSVSGVPRGDPQRRVGGT